MKPQRKNAVLGVIAALLLIVAGYRFWLLAMDARNRAELNRHFPQIEREIVSRVGPPKMDPVMMGPFANLGLTDEQRRKIDDILQESMPDLPPPEPDGQGKPHFFHVKMPMDKIRAVLTPEQRQKLDRLPFPGQDAIVGVRGGGPGIVGMRAPGIGGGMSGGGPGIGGVVSGGGQVGGAAPAGGPPAVFFHQGPPDSSP